MIVSNRLLQRGGLGQGVNGGGFAKLFEPIELGVSAEAVEAAQND